MGFIFSHKNVQLQSGRELTAYGFREMTGYRKTINVESMIKFNGCINNKASSNSLVKKE